MTEISREKAYWIGLRLANLNDLHLQLEIQVMEKSNPNDIYYDGEIFQVSCGEWLKYLIEVKENRYKLRKEWIKKNYGYEIKK